MKYENEFTRGLLGMGYRHNKKIAARNKFRSENYKANIRQEINEFIKQNPETNAAFEKHKDAIKEAALIRERPISPTFDKLLDDHDKVNDYLIKYGEDEAKKKHYSKEQTQELVGDLLEMYDNDDIIKAASKYDPSFKKAYERESKEWNEANKKFNAARDEIVNSIVKDNGDIKMTGVNNLISENTFKQIASWNTEAMLTEHAKNSTRAELDK